jgi:hypothetical protein
MAYTDNNTNAIYALNSYLRKLLAVNLGIVSADYGDKDPVIPNAQVPEMMQKGKPFIVYGSGTHPATHLYRLRKEAVSYTIYATSATEVNKIANLLVDAFERQDDCVTDVNAWIDLEGQPGNRTGGKRQIHFAGIRLTMSQKAEPQDEEGGYYNALIMLETQYVNLGTNIQTSFTSYA